MKKLFASLMFLSMTAVASPRGAVLKAISGPVTIESAASAKPARAGQFIGLDERVRVGAGGVAQVVFSNGDAVLVKENSVFRLDEGGAGNLVSFEQGEFLVGMPGKTKMEKPLRIKTPAAILMARAGAAFWGKIDAMKKTSCACFSGSLDVLASQKRVSLQSNETMEIAMGGMVSGPTVSKIDPIYVETFGVNGSLQGVDKVIKAGKK